MQQHLIAHFGRKQPALAALQDRVRLIARLRDTPPAPVADKWALFAQLRIARADWGLSDRDLTVLNALLSFHPGRDLGPDVVVFPSNARLADRAHGMAESTLRRHLAALVAAGIVLRRDSPNGKRFARGAGPAREAFGFDLGPLVLLAPEIAAAADATTARDAALADWRLRLGLRLRDLAAIATAHGLTAILEGLDQIRRLLRRRPDPALFADMENRLDALAETTELIGCDGQNERHNQSQIKDSFEEAAEKAPCAAVTEAQDNPATLPQSVELQEVLVISTEAQSFAAEPIRSWRALEGLAHDLHPHLGIGAGAWDRACRQMSRPAAAAVLCLMMQRLGEITNPAGYLGHLGNLAAQGRLSLKRLLGWAARGQRLTAVNHASDGRAFG